MSQMAPREKKKGKKRKRQESVTPVKTDWCVGDLVFVKVRGDRPWPAQIQRPEDYGFETQPHKTFVLFFGTSETSFCLPKRLRPFTPVSAEQLETFKRNPQLEKAIKLISAAYDDLTPSVTRQDEPASDKLLEVELPS